MSIYRIIQGDINESLRQWCRPGSFHACLCDPPYGFTAFKQHGKKTFDWEREGVPSTALWEKVFECLQPGSMLMAASGARLYHRMATRIESAGFLILDQFNWLYTGSSATGVREGIRLRPAVEPYVVAWKPRPKVGRRFNARSGLRGLPCDVAMDDPLMRAIEMDQPDIGQFFFCGKAGPSERIPGDDHPTHKPLALCEHLAGLMQSTRQRTKLLVPFCGVGSEMIGALRAGWPEVVGLEREKHYIDIAHKRIAKFTKGAVCR